MAEFVHTTTTDGIATVVIDRPDVHNAFNEVVIAELTAAFETCSNDDAVRVVILASTGPSYSAGADMHWMKRMVDYSMEENRADAADMARMLQIIRACDKATIARIHGAAFGGGVGLIAACDIAIAVREAVFALTEVKLGILPAVISPYVQEKIGPGHMRRFALTAERFTAEQAMQIGLVSEVVDDQTSLDERIAFFAKLIGKTGPQAIAHCKAVLRDIQPVDWDHATQTTIDYIAQRRVSDEGQEGLHAFLEKRTPGWIAADS